jgi:hypothetical protein
MRTRAGARMLGGSRPLGFPTLLDARQDANSPRTAVWTTASAWRASPLFRCAALDACVSENSPAVVCAGARPKKKNTTPQDCSRNLRRCPTGCAGRSMLFFFGRAPAYAVIDDGSRAQPCPRGRGQVFAGAGALSSQLGCTPGRGAILAALSGCQDGNG